MGVDWAELYHTMYQDVVRFLYRKVWDADRAQDLAQETFVRCLKQDADNPRALLFTVAANLARDEARTVLRRKKHLTLIRVDSEQRSPTSPLVEMEQAERLSALEQALSQLEEKFT